VSLAGLAQPDNEFLSAYGSTADSITWINWLNGHWGATSKYAGATYYTGTGGVIEYTITNPNNWVVACGRNIVKTGADGTIVNNVRTSLTIGGGGGGALGINIGVDIGGSTPEVSDWQFSKLYIWNYHLSDSDFKSTSQALNAELVNPTTDTAGGACQPCAHASHSPGGTATSRRPACLACPAFKNTTQVGSTVLQKCLCVPGHGNSASTPTQPRRARHAPPDATHPTAPMTHAGSAASALSQSPPSARAHLSSACVTHVSGSACLDQLQ